jgi:alpha-mannosidase
VKEEDEPQLFVFNPTNNSDGLSYFEFSAPAKESILGVQDSMENDYPVQPLSSSEEVIFENTFSPIMLRTGLKMLPGRQITDFFLNEVSISDSINSEICDITLVCGKVPIGEFSVESLKEQAIELINSKKYKKFHVKATLGSQQKYGVLAPLKGWSFNKFKLKDNLDYNEKNQELISSKNKIETKFYSVSFNSDGTFNFHDKRTNTDFLQLHKFEDYGDKGDEYTFGRIGPEQVKIKKVKRKLTVKGPLFSQIEQEMEVELFERLNENRDKREGSVTLPIKTVFKFYRDIERIDIKTTLTNYAKDHRLRICFDLPYSSLETLTSTHFGVVKRKSDPFVYEEYEEQPSGIQAQRKYIRIEDAKSDLAFNLFNIGLPEVELENNSRLALTLIRSVGFLSRADYDERPMHAGPFMATPGAQELGTEYTFDYSFLIHSKELPLHESDNQSESFCLLPKTIMVKNSELQDKLSQSIIHVVNPWIRISSLRNRNGELCVTLFNLNSEVESTTLQVNPRFSRYKQNKVDGTMLLESSIQDNQLEVEFKPYEIKMCFFS